MTATQGNLNEVAKKGLQAMLASITVFLGVEGMYNATRSALMDGVEKFIGEELRKEMSKLWAHNNMNEDRGVSDANKVFGLSYYQETDFWCLPFREKILFLVDKHTREFAAYWMLSAYPEIYRSLPDALEVVDDVCAAYYNGTPRTFPDPLLLEMLEG